MKKIILVCGLIGGVILCILMVISSAACYRNQNYDMGMFYGYAGMILAFSLIFVGIKNYRDKYNGGLISFGQAFKIGLYISLIGSTLYMLTWLVEYYLFIPDFMDKYSDHLLKNLQSSGATQIKIDSQVKDINSMKEMYKNPLFVILMTYLEVLPVALVITVISALILKRKGGKTTIALAG